MATRPDMLMPTQGIAPAPKPPVPAREAPPQYNPGMRDNALRALGSSPHATPPIMAPGQMPLNPGGVPGASTSAPAKPAVMPNTAPDASAAPAALAATATPQPGILTMGAPAPAAGTPAPAGAPAAAPATAPAAPPLETRPNGRPIQPDMRELFASYMPNLQDLEHQVQSTTDPAQRQQLIDQLKAKVAGFHDYVASAMGQYQTAEQAWHGDKGGAENDQVGNDGGNDTGGFSKEWDKLDRGSSHQRPPTADPATTDAEASRQDALRIKKMRQSRTGV